MLHTANNYPILTRIKSVFECGKIAIRESEMGKQKDGEKKEKWVVFLYSPKEIKRSEVSRVPR